MNTASKIRLIGAATLHACLISTLVLCLAGTSAALEFAGKFPPGPSHVGEVKPLAVAGDGSVYYHDPDSTGFLKVSRDGTKEVRLEAEAGSFNAIALASNGDIYVGSNNTYTVTRFHPDGTLAHTWGSEGSDQGQFNQGPSALAIASTGSVYVGDWVFTDRVNRLGGRIQEFTLDGGFVRQWLIANMPIALAVGPDGDIYANTGSGIYRYTTTGELVSSFAFSDNAPDIIHANGLVIADDGSIYVGGDVATSSSLEASGSNLCGVHHFGADGTYMETLGVCGDGDGAFSQPEYLARHTDGTLVVIDHNDRITQMGTDGTVLSYWGSSGAATQQFYLPRSVTFTNDGELLVGDHGNRRIKRYDAEGNYLGQWSEETSSEIDFYDLTAMTVASDGRIYTVSLNQRLIQQLQADGTFIRSWGERGSSGSLLDYPYDIAVTSDDVVLVVDWSRHVILRFQSDGTWLSNVYVFPGKSMALTPDGNIVVGANSKIFVYDSDLTELNQWATGFDVRGVAVAEDGTIFASDTDGSRLVRYASTGELLEEIGSEGYGDGQFSGILKLAIKGNMIYAVESTAGRVQYFRFSLRSRAGVAPLMLLLE